MKKHIVPIAITLGVVVMFFCFWYFTQTKEPERVVVYVLEDVTNPDVGYQQYVPKTWGKVLTKSFEIEQNKKGFYHFKDAPKYGQINFYPINGEVTPIDHTVEIPIIESTSPILKSNEIKKLFPEVKEGFKHFTDQFDQKHSGTEFYRSLVQQTARLSSLDVGENGRKIMIIYSDLLENSDLAKFYNAKNIPSCKEIGRSEVYEKLKSEMKLKRLEGIEFYIVSRINAKALGEKKLFIKAAQFWKCLLEGFGADVVCIASTLKFC